MATEANYWTQGPYVTGRDGATPGAMEYCATGKALDIDQALQAGAMHGRQLRASMAGKVKRGRQSRDHAYLEML